MTATGRNILKVIIGAAIAVVIAKAIANMEEREDIPREERVPISESVRNVPVRLQGRWERAREAGVAAEEEATASLTEIFRDKVSDPTALDLPKSSSS